jgi:hypothetical protein
MVDLSKYAWVTERAGIVYYRSILNPRDEIQVANGKIVKMKKKLRVHLKDNRGK